MDMEWNLTEAEWRRRLDPERFRVCRQGGTEPAFSGAWYRHKAPGIYTCVCCGAPLFGSDAKYDSGSGWPSFWHELDGRPLERFEDHSHGMHRTEVRCRRCGAHLGHLFPDGPPPTGLRYCINSICLDFESRGRDGG